MCDFDDEFDNDDFMDEISFDDEYDADAEMDEPFTDDSDLDGEHTDAESLEDDLTLDPFIMGGAMGFAYEEGLRGRKKRKRKSFRGDSD